MTMVMLLVQPTRPRAAGQNQLVPLKVMLSVSYSKPTLTIQRPRHHALVPFALVATAPAKGIRLVLSFLILSLVIAM